MIRNIAIFASGNGTNAENIIRHFLNSEKARVRVVITNNKNAYVLQRAKKYGVATIVTDKKTLENDELLSVLKSFKTDFIALAGFMVILPEKIVKQFSGKVVNIHPALLPKFGGKGMYGMNVHKAVISAGEKHSGITIHHVNEKYDNGKIIFQARCIVTADDTSEMLAEKIHALEYEHYPKVIEKLL